jgi:hypothetical protein
MSKVCDMGNKDKNIVCPFYKWHDKHHIVCEGVNDENVINLVFNDPKARRDYKMVYCRDIELYKSCRIAQALFKKYCEE